MESQLNALEELQANVIRKSLAKQEELIRYIVQQQDFQTQVQSCMHVLEEVETSLGEWELGIASGLGEMKEKLSLCEVRSFSRDSERCLTLMTLNFISSAYVTIF